MDRLAFGTLPSRLPRIGGMATMPSRLASLRLALPAILAQVERLYLYLDKYEGIPPDLAAEGKIVPLLPEPGMRPLGDSGKLLGLKAVPEPCLYFCFDDDILYPDRYVDHMVAALRRHRFKVVVGLHAAVYNRIVDSYIRSRQDHHYAHELQHDIVVDELGTGTVAFHSRCLDLDPRQWAYANMTDLLLAIEAVRQDVTRIAVRRPRDFLCAIERRQADSIYLQSLVDDSVQTRLLQAAMAHYPGRWCQSD